MLSVEAISREEFVESWEKTAKKLKL